MYELWARRRNGGYLGNSYELVEKFDRKEEIYFRLDCLDPEEFQEGIVLLDGHCVLYKVFELENKEVRRKR